MRRGDSDSATRRAQARHGNRQTVEPQRRVIHIQFRNSDSDMLLQVTQFRVSA